MEMRAMEQTQDLEQRVPGKAMSFSHFVATIAGGDFNHELTLDLSQIGAALNQHFQDHRGEPKAEIEIKVKFKLSKGVVQVLADKKVKLPKKPEAGALLFIGTDNQFLHEDPRQLTMGFQRSGPRPVS
jgi:hypothetical protein